MSKSKRSCFYILLCLSVIACGGHGGNAKDEDAILKRPPYIALTDSINGDAGDKAALYFRRGDLLSRNNLHELASSDYKQAWELHPDETTGLRYASTLSIIGRPNDAIRLLQDCRKKFPGNTGFSNMLGDLYMQVGETKQALQLYNDLLLSDSTSKPSHSLTLVSDGIGNLQMPIAKKASSFSIRVNMPLPWKCSR